MFNVFILQKRTENKKNVKNVKNVIRIKHVINVFLHLCLRKVWQLLVKLPVDQTVGLIIKPRKSSWRLVQSTRRNVSDTQRGTAKAVVPR